MSSEETPSCSNSDENTATSSPKPKRARMDSAEREDPSPVISALGKDNEQADDKRLEELDDTDKQPSEEPGVLEDSTQVAFPPVEAQLLPPIKYEYLDHTADVQIHSWGDSITEAFEQCAMGMFAYMTDIERVDNHGSEQIEASGHDMLSLLFGFLDEWLFLFNADPYFVARKINITSFDRENFKISAIGYGETFNLSKHAQGTEVKAITYSNMQFHEKDDYAEVFVIIDI